MKEIMKKLMHIFAFVGSALEGAVAFGQLMGNSFVLAWANVLITLGFLGWAFSTGSYVYMSRHSVWEKTKHHARRTHDWLKYTIVFFRGFQ